MEPLENKHKRWTVEYQPDRNYFSDTQIVAIAISASKKPLEFQPKWNHY